MAADCLRGLDHLEAEAVSVPWQAVGAVVEAGKAVPMRKERKREEEEEAARLGLCALLGGDTIS